MIDARFWKVDFGSIVFQVLKKYGNGNGHHPWLIPNICDIQSVCVCVCVCMRVHVHWYLASIAKQQLTQNPQTAWAMVVVLLLTLTTANHE